MKYHDFEPPKDCKDLNEFYISKALELERENKTYSAYGLKYKMISSKCKIEINHDDLINNIELLDNNGNVLASTDGLYYSPSQSYVNTRIIPFK